MLYSRLQIKMLMVTAGAGTVATCMTMSRTPCLAATGLVSLLAFTPTLLGRDSALHQPVTQQMKPGSSYLQALNSRSESFHRVSIEQHTRQRWAWVRVMKDVSCAGPEMMCGGRDGVRAMDRSFRGLIAQTIVTGVLGFVVPGLHSYTVVAATAAASLLAIDWVFDNVTSPGDGSDGLVPSRSQEYPGANVREVIYMADSHVAARKSIDRTLPKLCTVLRRDYLAVPVGGSQCEL